jgi:hypothetical protein
VPKSHEFLRPPAVGDEKEEDFPVAPGLAHKIAPFRAEVLVNTLFFQLRMKKYENKM